jgi:hypothetical protein
VESALSRALEARLKGLLIQNQEQHESYSASTNKLSAKFEKTFNSAGTNFVVVVVVVVVILSQTCNLRLTRTAMMSVWIRKFSNPK